MATTLPSTEVNLKRVFNQTIYGSNGRKLTFGDLFVAGKEENHLSRSLSTQSYSSSDNDESALELLKHGRRLLVIFIRHFFCGNCQEYLRCLASSAALSPQNLAKQNITVSIIGCGSPSLIESYRAIADVPKSWKLFADPSTEIYRILGMQRTLSLGDRSPKYIRRSLTGNMMRSVLQGIKRISQGDILAAGSWDVNGGEFLFRPNAQPSTKPQSCSWTLEWCHRMLNSRDHTEVDDLLAVLGMAPAAQQDACKPVRITKHHVRSQSTPLPPTTDLSLDGKPPLVIDVKRRPSLRKSLSVRRRSWMNKSSFLNRSMSMRVTSPT